MCSNHTYFGKIGVFCELGKFKFQRLNLFDSHYSETFSVVYCDPGHFFLGWTFVILLDTEGGCWSGHSPLPSKYNTLHTERRGRPPSPIYPLLLRSVSHNLFGYI